MERIQKLEDLDFIWDALEYEWNEDYKNLIQYAKDNGTTIVKRRYVVDDFPLGSWVNQQRRSMEKGRLSSLKIQKLEALGFIWDILEYEWNQGYQYLKQYIADTGSTSPKKGTEIDGYPIANWASYQRQRMAKGKLSPDKIQTLSNLGFIWKVEK